MRRVTCAGRRPETAAAARGWPAAAWLGRRAPAGVALPRPAPHARGRPRPRAACSRVEHLQLGERVAHLLRRARARAGRRRRRTASIPSCACSRSRSSSLAIRRAVRLMRLTTLCRSTSCTRTLRISSSSCRRSSSSLGCSWPPLGPGACWALRPSRCRASCVAALAVHRRTSRRRPPGRRCGASPSTASPVDLLDRGAPLERAQRPLGAVALRQRRPRSPSASRAGAVHSSSRSTAGRGRRPPRRGAKSIISPSIP